MKKSICVLTLLIAYTSIWAQNTFKAGWNTYNTFTITHEYTYTYTFADSIKLAAIDSSQIFATADSLVTLTVHFPRNDKSIYKTLTYLNAKKQIIKKEDYKDENLLVSKEWRYNDKGLQNYYYEDNKVNGNNYRKTYDHSTDKKTGEVVMTECSFFNGRIEFYTKSYFDKKGVKYKEIRLNDNNKDVVHIESFTYGENGKVKERSVYFPEWRVTKKFQEKEGNTLAKCIKILPVGVPDKVTIPARALYMKKVLVKNQPAFSDAECVDFEFKFRNFTTCEIEVCNGANAATRKAIFRYKEKL